MVCLARPVRTALLLAAAALFALAALRVAFGGLSAA